MKTFQTVLEARTTDEQWANAINTFLQQKSAHGNYQKNGCDAVGRKIKEGDYILYWDDRDLRFGVVANVTDRAVYFVSEYQGRQTQTFLAPYKVIVITDLEK